MVEGALTWSGVFGANYFDHWRFWDGGSLTLTGSLIDQADSLTGSGRDLFATGIIRPTLTADATLGKNVADFDGVSEYMRVFGSTGEYNFLHDGSGGCVIVIYTSYTTPAIQSQLVANSFGNIGFRIQHSPAGTINSVVRNASANIVSNLATEITTNGEYNSSVTTFDVGNATLADRLEQVTNSVSEKNNSTSGTPTAANAANNLTIGRRSNASSFYLDGSIAEVIILDTIPTPSQLADIQTILSQDYGSFPIS